MAKVEEADGLPDDVADYDIDESTDHLRELQRQNEHLAEKRTQLTEDMGCRFGEDNNRKHTHTHHTHTHTVFFVPLVFFDALSFRTSALRQPSYLSKKENCIGITNVLHGK